MMRYFISIIVKNNFVITHDSAAELMNIVSYTYLTEPKLYRQHAHVHIVIHHQMSSPVIC